MSASGPSCPLVCIAYIIMAHKGMGEACVLKCHFQSKDLRHPDVNKLCSLLCTLLLMTSTFCDGPRNCIRSVKNIH